jgi:hypothetical protein
LALFEFPSPYTLWENENERQKTEQVPIPLPRAAGSCFEAKKMKKFFLLAWTLEIIQFIRFENHMDRPRYLKKKLGYPIKYLSIWYFISHGCFTARSVLKFGFVT